MILIKIKVGWRLFIKILVVIGGGILIGFNWFVSCIFVIEEEFIVVILNEWFDINGYIKIGDMGMVIIYFLNLEIG